LAPVLLYSSSLTWNTSSFNACKRSAYCKVSSPSPILSC
jgi:hypothetical protein